MSSIPDLPAAILPTTRLTLDPHVRFRRFEDEGVLVNQTSAEALVVNEVAARLIEVLDGARTLRDCAGLLAGEFETTTDVVETDLLRFAGELLDAGLVRPIETRS